MSPMIHLHKRLPRRTILRGMGAAIALPFLESMTPAFAAITRAASPRIRRLGVIYVPNGMNMGQWTPTAPGDLEMTRILKPLAQHRDKLLLVGGLDNSEADGRKAGSTNFSAIPMHSRPVR